MCGNSSALPLDVRKSYAFPKRNKPFAAMPRDGGVAADLNYLLSEKRSFSAHRAAEPKRFRKSSGRAHEYNAILVNELVHYSTW
jgi:hypothetical protein